MVNQCKLCQNSVPFGEQTDWRDTYPMADTTKWECYFGIDGYPECGHECPEYMEIAENEMDSLLTAWNCKVEDWTCAGCQFDQADPDRILMLLTAAVAVTALLDELIDLADKHDFVVPF